MKTENASALACYSSYHHSNIVTVLLQQRIPSHFGHYLFYICENPQTLALAHLEPSAVMKLLTCNWCTKPTLGLMQNLLSWTWLKASLHDRVKQFAPLCVLG